MIICSDEHIQHTAFQEKNTTEKKILQFCSILVLVYKEAGLGKEATSLTGHPIGMTQPTTLTDNQ